MSRQLMSRQQVCQSSQRLQPQLSISQSTHQAGVPATPAGDPITDAWRPATHTSRRALAAASQQQAGPSA
jgi:hypothetical protein